MYAVGKNPGLEISGPFLPRRVVFFRKPLKPSSPEPKRRAFMSPLLRIPLSVAPFCVLAVGGGTFACAQELAPPSQEEIEAARSAPLFASHELLEITLEADFQALKKEDRSRDSREERPGVLRWTDAGGSANSQEIQIRTRGNFRLSQRNCDFPPLRLNVKKGATKGTLFDGQDKLKLVVTCKLGQDYWEQYVLLEYMAYRTLNVLTDLSLRVRLARVTYVDTSGKDDPFTRFAFLIEPDEMMALRNNARVVEWNTGQLDPRLVEARTAILMDSFEYMIGNTDWSGVEMHNMILVRTWENVPYTVPYDFDFSGLVNARYATPDQSLSISRVRQRLFRGFCPENVNRSQAEYDAVYGLFQEKKDEIYQMWRSLEGLDRNRMEDTLEYFDEFYETIGDPKLIESRMMRNCRRVGD
jgi:hypothetical protein